MYLFLVTACRSGIVGARPAADRSAGRSPRWTRRRINGSIVLQRSGGLWGGGERHARPGAGGGGGGGPAWWFPATLLVTNQRPSRIARRRRGSRRREIEKYGRLQDKSLACLFATSVVRR